MIRQLLREWGLSPFLVAVLLQAPEAAASEDWFLDSDDDGWSLASADGRHLPLPLEWLWPESERAAEQDSYVSSIEFDRHVQVFPIGDGRLGVHVSSYAIAGEGSADAAAGRDVFLVLDRERATPGGIQLGITKARQRCTGVAEAVVHHWYLQDRNGDGLTDIGVVRETGQCAGGRFGIRSDSEPVWFLFQEDGWIREPEPSGISLAEDAAALPLIGLTQSPVDYLRERCVPQSAPRQPHKPERQQR